MFAVTTTVLLAIAAGDAPKPPYDLKPIAALPSGETGAKAESTILTNVIAITDADLGFARAGEAYFAPDMRTVIFQASKKSDDPYQMFTMRLDADGKPVRTSLKRVSPAGGANTCGFFHPKRPVIIFGSSYLHPNMPNPNKYQREGSSYQWKMPGGMEIIQANRDGSSPKPLTTSPGYDAECAYDAAGERIVFCSDRDGDPDIYVMRADGTNVKQITNHPGYDGGPFFSPDGKRIVFRADRKGNDHLQLFVIDADGKNERQLSQHGDVVRWAPFWHPNGRTLVYTTSVHGHWNYEVYLLNIETGKSARVTWSPRFDGLPAISPDGKKMMWTSMRSKDESSQVFIGDFRLPPGF